MVKNPRRGWEFPGGQVEEGEDLISAVTREIEEESGVVASITRMTGVYSNVRPPTKVIFTFEGEYVSGELQTTDESLETVWVNREEALGRATHPAITERIKQMLAYSGQVHYQVYMTNPFELIEERFL